MVIDGVMVGAAMVGVVMAAMVGVVIAVMAVTVVMEVTVGGKLVNVFVYV